MIVKVKGRTWFSDLEYLEFLHDYAEDIILKPPESKKVYAEPRVYLKLKDEELATFLAITSKYKIRKSSENNIIGTMPYSDFVYKRARSFGIRFIGDNKKATW